MGRAATASTVAVACVAGLCGPLGSAQASDWETPTPHAGAATAAATPLPFLPVFWLRAYAQQYVEEIDVAITSHDRKSYVNSCAKISRNSGVCTFTSWVTFPDDSFSCYGRVQITVDRTRHWHGRSYAYRCP